MKILGLLVVDKTIVGWPSPPPHPCKPITPDNLEFLTIPDTLEDKNHVHYVN
ncbi:hypothetical protein [Umezakia ovalisporum]|uniref:hypothetical protein n=1 Tax=Umezakia ovalisporum TaxID=75695 RepID=UPI002476CB7A|nr:hypothetical protein [Umezakia ovalisporum]MDH6082418.1 hypothetical protein [Umezakia ovalisporum FSS-44]